MTGETNLERLLATMSPELAAGEYVFCTLPDAEYGDYSDLEPVATVSEREGLTVVIPRINADQAGLIYESVFKRITLRIHSSLDAVGLTSAFSAKLTAHGISANVVAGYYHDHIFVQINQAEKAIEALNELSSQ